MVTLLKGGMGNGWDAGNFLVLICLLIPCVHLSWCTLRIFELVFNTSKKTNDDNNKTYIFNSSESTVK